MYPLLRKISLLSTCIRSLDGAFIPGFNKLKKVMSYTRRDTLGFKKEFHTIDYNHTSQGKYLHNEANKFQELGQSSDMATPKPININCGKLRRSHQNVVVRMFGRVKFQRVRKFLNLSDTHGDTQLVVPEERLDLVNEFRNIPDDSHIEIIGTVRERPEISCNRKSPTGEIEVVVDKLLDLFTPKRKANEIDDEETPQQDAKKVKTKIALTTWESTKCVTNAARKKFSERTHRTSDLNEFYEGANICLSGWLSQRRTNFLGALSDGYGEIQLVLKDVDPSVDSTFNRVQINTTPIIVVGVVKLRPMKQRTVGVGNRNIELRVTKIEIININEVEDKATTNSQENDVVDQVEPQPSVSESPGGVNSYCSRTHTCGELGPSDVHKEVVLCGWLESIRTNRFARIRDGHGSTQLIISTEDAIVEVLQKTNLESVIKVTGTVALRPVAQIMQGDVTGEIEVFVKTLDVLNPAKSDLPFIIRLHNRPKEKTRMKYRYLDLRFKDMQYRLRLRSEVLMRMREFLINRRGFVEVETPTLFRRTPGGAQEFVVPTRTEGKFYSLVQSPQQLKQLLMIGSMDRYFQVARCYRDEGARPDRQPEFTQMDIELSFTDKNQIMLLIEDMLKASFPHEKFTIQTPFPVITYQEAMHWYGSDKPDLSFENKLIDISELIENKDLLPANVQDVKNFTAKALIFDKTFIQEEKLRDAIRDCEDEQKLKGDNKCKIISARCEKTEIQRVEESLPFLKAEKLRNAIEIPNQSIIVVGVGKENEILPLMGKLRSVMFKKPTNDLHFAWIVDFPLFLEQDDGTLESAHHPFTQPHEQDFHLLESNPLKVRGLHFDLVLNGYEVGGGSVRIHDPSLQAKVLKDILKIQTDSLNHLLEALASGAPPHGGIALGIDRLFSIMVGADSIRDVIAFPKGVDGKDPLSGAPCAISSKEKRLYHLIPRSSK